MQHKQNAPRIARYIFGFRQANDRSTLCNSQLPAQVWPDRPRDEGCRLNSGGPTSVHARYLYDFALKIAASKTVLDQAWNRFIGNLRRFDVSTTARLFNDLTGYTAVDELKLQVAKQDQQWRLLKALQKEHKRSYEGIETDYHKVQKELQLLLQKKSSWKTEDPVRFAEVCTQEHSLEQRVSAARNEYEKVTEQLEIQFDSLMKSIQERYTLEQLWSEKIRRASTWWTWILMGVQFFSYVALFLVIEPYRRMQVREQLEAVLPQLVRSTLEEVIEERFPKAGGVELHSTSGERPDMAASQTEEVDVIVADSVVALNSRQPTSNQPSIVLEGTVPVNKQGMSRLSKMAQSIWNDHFAELKLGGAVFAGAMVAWLFSRST